MRPLKSIHISSLSVRSRLRIATGAALLTLVSFLSGCHATAIDTWHCYDEHGKPVNGVLFLAKYMGSTPMSYYPAGVDYRLTDENGIARFGRDEMAKKIGDGHLRSIGFIYSLRLHAGTTGNGKYYHEGETPDKTEPIYRQDALGESNIHIRDCEGDPSRWYDSLESLLQILKSVRERSYAWDGVGIESVETVLATYAENERASFIEKYGETSVPLGRFSLTIKYKFPDLPQDKWAYLKFKDITPPLP